jgi:hypothetical protein
MTNQNKRAIPGCKAMSKHGFWNLIAEVKAACGQEQDKYMDMLKNRLKEMGPDHAQDFHDIVHAYEKLAYKYGLWSAAELMGYISDDGFMDFRAWLISQGREAYFAALKDPDTLAGLDHGNNHQFESFTFAGYFALEELTNENAYENSDEAAFGKIVEALKLDIEYAGCINYPFEPSETADYFPRLYQKHMAVSEPLRSACEIFWNQNNKLIAKARRAGLPPKPQNNMEMGGM